MVGTCTTGKRLNVKNLMAIIFSVEWRHGWLCEKKKQEVSSIHPFLPALRSFVVFGLLEM